MERTEAFRVLASVDRQLLLHELIERDGRATTTELSRGVASLRHRAPPEKLDDEAIRRAQVRLVHTHIPELADRGVVEIHENEGTDEDDATVEDHAIGENHDSDGSRVDDWNDVTDRRDVAVSLTDEESVERLFDAAEELDSWPPDDLVNRPPL